MVPFRSGTEGPESHHASHFSRVSDIARCTEILVKSVVCMTKHLSPKRTEDGLLVGWRVGSSTALGLHVRPISFSHLDRCLPTT